jgi:hypothetical protein
MIERRGIVTCPARFVSDYPIGAKVPIAIKSAQFPRLVNPNDNNRESD